MVGFRSNERTPGADRMRGSLPFSGVTLKSTPDRYHTKQQTLKMVQVRYKMYLIGLVILVFSECYRSNDMNPYVFTLCNYM